jgi:hypothetical protein
MNAQERFAEGRRVHPVGRRIEEKPRATEPEGRAVPTEKLSKGEKARLEDLELIIGIHLASFIKVGLALAQIRKENLYREESPTFEGYCEKKWGFSSSRARQLIGAAAAMKNLETATKGRGINLPANEGQVRPLLSLGKKDQVEVWEESANSVPNGKPTASVVEEIAAKRRMIYLPGRRGEVKKPKTVIIKPGDKNFGTLLKALPPEYRKGNVVMFKLTPIVRGLGRVSVRQVNLGV